MTEATPQDIIYEAEDMRAIRALFTENGVIKPKHRRALDVLERFARVKSTSFGFNTVEHTKLMGRMEIYNLILRYAEMPQDRRVALNNEARRLKNG